MKSTKQKLPPNIECVTAYQAVSRLSNDGWMGKQKHRAKVTVSYVYRCKVCDDYFQTLGEAKEHPIGKRH